MDIASFLKDKHFEFKSDGTLFGIEPLIAITHKVCPFCFCKLYEMKYKPFFYCRSKKHKNKFMISKEKMNSEKITPHLVTVLANKNTTRQVSGQLKPLKSCG